jgi:hypothetical protein
LGIIGSSFALCDEQTAELVRRAALELVHRHDMDDIESVLTSAGVSSREALKLMLLLPSVFAREHDETEGIESPEHFFVGPLEGRVERSYESEPIYLSARELARKWMAEGSGSLVGRVLEWSAEASSIKEAREKGLKPTRMSAVHHGFDE